MDTIEKELDTILIDLDLFDEHECLERLNMGQLRHICRYFYNLGKIETRQ
jgi:hypothetical protein